VLPQRDQSIEKINNITIGFRRRNTGTTAGSNSVKPERIFAAAARSVHECRT